MNLKNILSKFRSKPQSEHNFIGAPSFAHQNPGFSFLNCFQSDSYASIYPSIKAITNKFMTIPAFAIDANGKPVEKTAAVNALYHPNQEDSSVAFAEKLAVMNLTHRKTYILVWRRENGEAKPGGIITPDNIAGYTFLERPGVTRRDGVTYYQIGAQSFTEKEVMVITGGVDPHSLGSGYAPGEASRRWAKLDDYIADYQAGFFENGAVPSGQFIITASSNKDFDDTVDAMQAKHRGAGQNNNVTYTPRPIDPNTGKPGDSKIQWIPFASSNKDIDFKNLFEQANKRIDSTFGVPASVRGVGENNNYATARVDQQNFILNTVNPLALRIYTQITHELNRITNGLGYAITYHLDIPVVADEEKVQAETKSEEVKSLLLLTDKGYSLDSTVDALALSPRYKLLKMDASTPEIKNDKPDVDEGGEVNDSPDPDKIDGLDPNVGAANRKNPKAATQKTDQERIEDVASEFMQAQVDTAIRDLKEEDEPSNEVTGDPTEAQKAKFVADALEVIVSIMGVQGVVEYAAGESMIAEAGVSTEALTEFKLSDTARSGYEAYLRRVGDSYSYDTKLAIQKVLSIADQKGLTRAATEKELAAIMNTDAWRVKRIGVTELNRSQALSGIESMKQIQAESGATIEKGLQHTGGDSPCEFCRTLLDSWVAVDQDLIPLGGVVVGEDGGLFVNDFVGNDGYDVHPNGHCVPEFRVVK